MQFRAMHAPDQVGPELTVRYEAKYTAVTLMDTRPGGGVPFSLTRH